ncbi:MAG TPA: GNAT family N-acetyltransferase [Mycobacteriales bacterium]
MQGGHIVWLDLVGHRVVVRRSVGPRHGRSRYSDVLGHLEAADGDALVVRRADGSRVSVPVSEVHLIKGVPPAPVRTTRADVLALEAVAALGWPAPDTERIGGWLLRAGAGFTNRANSVLPLDDPGLPAPVALARVESWYDARGLPARFQLPLPVRADLDTELHQRGYLAHDPTYVLTAGLPAVLGAAAGDPGSTPVPPGDLTTRLASEPDPEWLTGYHHRGAPDLPPVAVQIMTSHPRVVFASSVRDGQTLAVARAVVDQDWVGLTALEVREDQRRQGLASRLLRAVLEWADTQGASRIYLQVAQTNIGALALYDRLGFARHHQYRYRVGPAIRPTQPG